MKNLKVFINQNFLMASVKNWLPLLFSCLIIIMASVAASAQKTWQGDVSSDWDDSANWSGNAVPTATSEVFIPVGTPFSAILSSTTTINELRVSGELTIDVGAELTVTGASANLSVRVDEDLALLTVSGIMNIECNNLGDGLSIKEGTFRINNGGEVNIQDCPGDGMVLEANLGDVAAEINGQLTIENITDDGIDINRTHRVSQLTVGTTGRIDIKDSHPDADDSSHGILCNEVIVNNGEIEIVNVKGDGIVLGGIIEAFKEMTNNGSLIIESARNGISIFDLAQFTNGTNATISIKDIVRDGILMDEIGPNPNHTNFDNYGEILLGSQSQQIGRHGMNMFQNVTFTNHTTGNLVISYAGEIGIVTDASTPLINIFNNHGSIMIEYSAAESFYMNQQNDFNNFENATFTIKDPLNGSGISMDGDELKRVINNGAIEILNVPHVGLLMDGDHDTGFFNETTGSLIITNPGFRGIDPGNAPGSVLQNFKNSGYLEITVTGEAMMQNIEFTNKSGGTLAGYGNIPPGTLDLEDDCILSPGTATELGIINFINTNPDLQDIILNMDIEGTAGPGLPGGHDQITLAGALTLNGATLNMTGSYMPTNGDSFIMIDNTSSNNSNHQFDGLDEGDELSFNGGLLQISYGGGDGNEVVLFLSEPTWTGNTSDDWNDPTNWLPNAVPGPNDDVFIPNVNTHDPVIDNSLIVHVKSVTILAGGYLEIGSSSQLNIDGSEGDAMDNSGEVVNYGTLIIGMNANIGGNGISNHDDFINFGGIIQIGNFAATGIYNTGKEFRNRQAGQILIGHAFGSGGTIGLKNDGANAEFFNVSDCIIKIDNATETGFLNDNGASFINRERAKIIIGENGNMPAAYGLRCSGSAVFSNFDCSQVHLKSNDPIETTGTFNNDSRIINESTSPCNITTNNGFVVNLNGGVFNIGTDNGYLLTSIDASWTGCNSKNWNDPANWLNENVPTNSTDVIIRNVFYDDARVRQINPQSQAKSVLVENGGYLTINNNRTLNINGSVGHGIENHGQIDNFGTLNIGQTTAISNAGIYNENIFNNDGGTINIDNTGDNGIDNQSPSFENKNNSEILVGQGAGNIGNRGIRNTGTGSKFTNDNATIKIDNTAENGLLNTSDAEFINTNYALLTIGEIGNIGGNALQNSNNAISKNLICSEIFLLDKLNNQSTFENGALAHYNTSQTATINGTFSNDGIVEDIQGSLPTVAPFINNEIVIAPTTSNDCEEVSPAFNLDNPVGFNILGIFTDQNATSSAGTYDVGTNTFFPTATLASGTHSFYVKTEDTVNNCEFVVFWELITTDCCPQFVTCYLDNDNDGFGDPSVSQVECQTCSTGYVTDNTDCDDNDPAEFPGQIWYLDGDNDGYSDGSTQTTCERPANHKTAGELTSADLDCNDNDGTINPGAVETCNGIDDDCDNLLDSNDPSYTDTEKPSLGCPANRTVAMHPGQCGAVVNWPTPNATDNCDGTFAASQTMGNPGGSLFAEGIQTIEYTATDAAGNFENCTFTIMVQPDAQKPSLSCPSNLNVPMDVGQCGAVVNWATPNATDNCDGTFAATQTQGSPGGSFFTEGTQTIEYTAADGVGNEESCTFTVTVQPDAEKPALTCPSNVDVAMDVGECGATVNWSTPDATDNCDGTFAATQTQGDPSGSFFAEGIQMIEYTATDGSGNAESCTFTVAVQPDAEKPSLNCSDDMEVAMDVGACGASVAWSKPAANDNCDGNFVATQTMGLPVGSFFTEGTHMIEYTATDAAGNEESCTFNVTVQSDAELPVPTCKSNVPVELNASGNYIIQESDVFDSGTDNCGTVNYVGAAPATVGCADAGNTVSITATINDGNGNEGTCTATVIVSDNFIPTTTCLNPTVQLDISGTHTLSEAEVFNGGTDNCGDVTFVSVIPETVDCSHVGNNPVAVTVTGTDENGNENTCTANVTVEDNMAPSAVCLHPSISLNEDGTVSPAGADVVDFVNSTDNCNDVFFAGTSPAVFNCTDVGVPVPVQVTIRDNSGNESTCTAQVTLLLPATCNGTLRTWTGSVSSDWNDPCNWNPICVPVAQDDVTIPDTANDPIILNGTIAFAKSVNVQANATLTIESSGSLTIDDAASDGISNQGTIENAGVITIGSNGSIAGFGIFNSSIFNNLTGATVHIDQVQSSAIINVTGGVFTNEGVLNIGQKGAGSTVQTGINNIHVFHNNTGSIYIDHTELEGIFNSSTGHFTNKAFIAIGLNGGAANIGENGISNFGIFKIENGEIQIENTMLDGFSAQGNNGEFLNLSTLGIRNVGRFGINVLSGSFENQGEISIQQTGQVGLKCQSGLPLENSGTISIVDTQEQGVFNQGTIHNDGTLQIGLGAGSNNIALSGIENQGGFKNTLNGEVHIANTPEKGFVNYQVLDNEGTVYIGQIGTTVSNIILLGLENYGTVNNLQGGVFHINHISEIGLYSDDTFYNEGIINIGQPNSVTSILNTGLACTNQFYNKPGGVVFIGNCGGSGLINNEQYQNEACATTTIQVALQNFGAFNNLGLLTLDTDESHVVGNFTNDGIVEDVQGGFVGATNNEIIIAPIMDDCVEINPAFQLGNPVDFNILGVYTDENATMPAGTYDLASNTFTSNVGAGQFDLFVEIEDPSNGCTRIVSWSVDFGDSTPPVPNCTSNVTVTLDANGSYTVQEGDVFAGGTDNCGTVNFVGTAPATVDCSNVSNNPSILVTVNDGNGNEATCTAIINVEDSSQPEPVCLNPTVELDGTGNYSLAQSEVFDGGTDNCSTINFLSMSPESVDCSDAGSTVQVAVTAFDASGNQATCEANVTVEDNEQPEPDCLSPTVSLNTLGNHTLSENEVFGGGTDNCGPVTFVEMSPTSVGCGDVGSIVDVTVTATDTNGNENFCTATVTVIDVVAPITSCQDVTIELDSDGNASIDESMINDGSSDNCGIASLVLEITSFGCAQVGANSVQLVVTDVNGNVENCMATVTVEDHIAPTATCTATIINATLDSNGEYTVDPNELDDGSSDACGILGFSADPSLLNCQNVGNNTVTMAVTDVNGNTSSCTATVHVADFITIDNIIETAESCTGAGDGSLLIEASTGGGQIGYSIDGGVNFQFNQIFNSLSPGTYNIVVKAFGIPAFCEATSTAVIVAGNQPQTWYRDMDGDQYSDGISMVACSQPAGYYLAADLLSANGDCNDSEAAVHPGAIEICDGLDNNCDGQLMAGEVDADGDGFLACDGDCDDSDPNVHPGATEVCNGIDDDCDGEIDEGTIGGLTWTGNLLFTTQAQVDDFSQCYSIIDGSVTINGLGITDLSNLSNIEEITGNLTIQGTGLVNMNGLDNLVVVGGTLTIYFNSSLTSLAGLDVLGSVEGSLVIYYNFNLSDGCAIYNLVNGGVNGNISIFFNATGCNSVAEINANCGPNNLISDGNTGQAPFNEPHGILTEGGMPEPAVTIFPNPATHVATLRFDGRTTSGNVMVSDVAGREVWQGKVKGPTDRLTIHLPDWRAGAYYIRIKLDGRKLVTKKLMVADRR